ncbi:caspase family protein [Ralstonia chuxiongensis]|uniref:caspase family protein n=1 Tax=Ralstonia chuxiongensis TaxID=2957504 RepID=UPI0028F5A490|nr:caspase family protein [Ralstonia chuxiongensis]CAJ0785114.1 hypothetical protein R8510_05343 [Ralstonia chuxiongensis]
MIFRAVFVGVNKQVDQTVSELPGAKRDALTLWSLFSDTFPELSSTLLIDESATKEAASRAILQALDTASDEDVIILSFAGHGTPDGGLAFYDTDSTDLSGTTLPMTILADAFRTTKARAVLFVLDSCFSGHAPARVFEVNAT